MSRESHNERSQSSRFLFCCHEGMVGTGDGSVIFSRALRFISRFALAEICVVLTSTCPRKSRIMSSEIPLCSKCIPLVCRKVCGLTVRFRVGHVLRALARYFSRI